MSPRKLPKAVRYEYRALWTIHLDGTVEDLIESYLRERADGRADHGWQGRHLQGRIDALLRQILEGKDARTVFKLGPHKKRGERKDIAREQCVCLEFMRLAAIPGVSEPQAKDAVADAYPELSMRAIERAIEAWRVEFERIGTLDAYVATLKAKRLL